MDVCCWQCVGVCPVGSCVCWATVVCVCSAGGVGRWIKQKQLFIKQRQVWKSTADVCWMVYVG
jgi:hypothetical protein